MRPRSQQYHKYSRLQHLRAALQSMQWVDLTVNLAKCAIRQREGHWVSFLVKDKCSLLKFKNQGEVWEDISGCWPVMHLFSILRPWTVPSQPHFAVGVPDHQGKTLTGPFTTLPHFTLTPNVQMDAGWGSSCTSESWTLHFESQRKNILKIISLFKKHL